MAKNLVAIIMVVALASIFNPISADSDMLQDVCVADLASGVKVNGFPCKSAFSASDFFSTRLATPGSTANLLGSVVTTANVNQIPGLNTVGVSIARIDYAPGGLNPPHTHPRTTEIAFVLSGKLDVAFITTANVLVSQTIKEGEVFVFPKGLVHYQKNSYRRPASVIITYNSQLAGTHAVATTLFTSKPSVPNAVLAQSFQISSAQVDIIRENLTPE